MTGFGYIPPSLAAYRAIGAQRFSFRESHDAVIRRALAERAGRRAQMAGRAASAAAPPQRCDRVRVVLFGREQEMLNPYTTYPVIPTALIRHKSLLLQLLATQGSARRRRVAQSPEALFVTTPHLADGHAHQIAPDWYIDPNVWRAQIAASLTVAPRLAGYRFGEDVPIVEA